ncbi:MAG: CopG family ribbon-helix-helix protein, partial [Acidithiobacillus sp.]
MVYFAFSDNGGAMSSVLTIRVPEELQQELGGLAEMTGRSRSWLAAEAIREYL